MYLFPFRVHFFQVSPVCLVLFQKEIGPSEQLPAFWNRSRRTQAYHYFKVVCLFTCLCLFFKFDVPVPISKSDVPIFFIFFSVFECDVPLPISKYRSYGRAPMGNSRNMGGKKYFYTCKSRDMPVKLGIGKSL